MTAIHWMIIFVVIAGMLCLGRMLRYKDEVFKRYHYCRINNPNFETYQKEYLKASKRLFIFEMIYMTFVTVAAVYLGSDFAPVLERLTNG